MDNTLTVLLNSKQNSGTITVKIIKKINDQFYIIADKTSYALLDLTAYPSYSSLLIPEGSYKLIKVTKNKDTITPSNFQPIKSKQEIKPTQEGTDRISKLEKQVPNKSTKSKDEVSLRDIEEKIKDNTFVANIKVMITTISRIIETKNGNYKIASIADKDGNKATLNLYDKHTDQIELGQIYHLAKVKKISITKEGQKEMRLCATKFSTMNKVEDENDTKDFEDVIIGDARIKATIDAIVDLSFYQACPKHLYKIDSEMNCPACNEQVEHPKLDFNAKFYVSTDDDNFQITFFKRQVDNIFNVNDNEDEIEKKLNLLVDQTFSIDYKENQDQQLVLMKIK